MLSRLRAVTLAVLVFGLFAGANSAFAQTVDTGFDPNADDTVRDVHVLPNGNMLVAGDFSNIAGHPTNGIALLAHNGNAITSFTSGLTATENVRAFALDASGNIVVVGADTSSGFVRRLIGATGVLDISFSAFGGITGTVVSDLAIQADGNIVIGGDFSVADGVLANNIARLSGTDGDRDLSFDPDANGQVYTITIQPSDQKILIGGAFTTVGGNAHSRIARLETSGTPDATFTPNADALVLDIALQLDGKILLAGAFVTLNGNAGIQRLGRVNADGTLDAAFTPSATVLDWTVSTIEIQADAKILVGGGFTNYAARFEFDGSTDTSFILTHTPNAQVLAIAQQQDGNIVLGGSFVTFAPGPIVRNRIARVSPFGVLENGFDPVGGPDGNVFCTATQAGGKIIVGGQFTNFNGEANTSRIARLNADGSVDPTFNTGTGAVSGVISVAIQADGKIIVGGSFTSFNGAANTSRIVRLNTDGSVDGTFNTGIGATNSVFSVAIQADGKIIVGGWFSSFNGAANTNNIARLNADGSVDPTFNTGTGLGPLTNVFSTAIQADGKIIIGGNFISFDGTTGINRIARLNANGTLDTAFSAAASGGANSDVYSTSIQADGKIIIGGNFTSFDGTTGINRIVRLNTDGSVDPTFNTGTGANAAVRSTAIQADGKIIIGGIFSNFNVTTSRRIARLNADGSIDSTFSTGTGASAAVFSTAIQADGKVIIGGQFISFNGTGSVRIARLSNTGAALQQIDYTGSAFSFTPEQTMPTALRLEFETSTDGVSFTSSGLAVWNAGAWELAATLPAGINWLRAKAHIQGGSFHGHSEYTVEFTRAFLVAAPTNAAPVVTLGAGPIAFVEDTGAVEIDAAATVTDADGGDFDTGTMTVSITANSTIFDRLLAITGGGLTVTLNGSTYEVSDGTNVFATYPQTGAGSGVGTDNLVVTFNAFSTPALAEALLQVIVYNNVSQDPSSATRTIEVTVTDGDGGTSNQPTLTVTVAAVNDAPVAGGPVGFSNWGEGSTLSPNMSVSDADIGSGDFYVTLTAAWGDFTLASTTGITFENGTANGQSTVEFTGNLADVNAAISPLSLQMDADFFGATNFTMLVSDQGNTGSGGVLTHSWTPYITITPVNDAPTFMANNTPAINEDAGAQVYPSWAAFSAGPANESSQTVVAYAVSNISNTGLFSVAPAVSTSGDLTFTPAANAFGTSTFDVTVQDSGGVVNGGVDTSAVQTFTVVVNSINDAPSFAVNAISDVSLLPILNTQTGFAHTFDVGGGAPESGQTATYAVLNKVAVGAGDATVNVLANGDLQITPNGAGTATITFDLQVSDGGGTANGGVETFAITILTFDIVDVTILYVDASWTGTTVGNDPDGAGPATSYGTDSFDTFDAAYAAAGAGTSEIVTTGTAQTVTNPVAKDLKLTGGVFNGLATDATVEIDGVISNGGAGTALRVAGGTLTITNALSLDADIGATLFDNQTAAAFDLSAVTLTLSAAAPADNFAVEDAIVHAMDNLAFGVVTWSANNWFATVSNLGINRAISLSTSGTDTVNIGAGTFNEFVLIDEDITLVGQGAGTTVIAPTTGPVNQAAIQIDATGVTVRDLSVNIDQTIFNCGIGSLSTQACDGALIQDVTVTDVGTSLVPVMGGWGGSSWGVGIGFIRAAASTDSVTLGGVTVNSLGNAVLARAIWLQNLRADVTGGSAAGWVQGLAFILSSGTKSVVNGMSFSMAGLDLSSPRSEIDVINCVFDTLVPGQFVAEQGILARDFTDALLIQGNTFVNQRIGVFLGSCENATVSNNTFQSADNTLFPTLPAAAPYNSGVYEFSHIIVNSSYPTAGTPVSTPMQNISIDGNTFSNNQGGNSRPLGRAIDLRDGNSQTWTNLSITSNTFEAELPEFIRMQHAAYLEQTPPTTVPLTQTLDAGPFNSASNNPAPRSFGVDLDVSTNNFAGITLATANGGEIISIESRCQHRNDNPYLGLLSFGFPALVDVASTSNDTATDNDFLTLLAAFDAAGDGQTVQLTTPFDLTQTFAAAAYALGRDGVTGTGDLNLDGIQDDVDDGVFLVVPHANRVIDGNDQLVDGSANTFLRFYADDFMNGSALPASTDYTGLQINSLNLDGFAVGLDFQTSGSGLVSVTDSVLTNIYLGIVVQDGSEVSVSSSVFDTITTSGVLYTSATLANVNNCSFISTGTGVSIDAASTVSGNLQGNSFETGSTGVDNQSGASVDCSNCWWGTETGPTHTSNVGGTGAAFTEAVASTDFAPWAASGVDTNAGAVGFQGGDNGSLGVALHGLPEQLVVTTQPVSPAIAGSPIAAVVVSAQDSSGNPAFNFDGANGVVDVSLNAGGANLTGGSTTTVNAVNGTATFSNLTIDYGAAPAVLDFLSNNGFSTAPNATINVSSNPFAVDLPQPLIGSVAPALVNEDIGGVTLSIFGANFYNSTTVTFGGNAVSSLTISGTSILASVPAGLLTNPGLVAVQVFNLFNGGSAPLAGIIVINDIPDAALLSTSTVAENMAVGTVVGVLSTVDIAPAGDSHTYTLLTGATNFEVAGTQLRTRSIFDFEGGPTTYNISIRVTDNYGGSMTTAHTITVTDANDVPVAVADSAIAATEDTQFVSAVSLLANDTDESGTIVGLSSPNVAILVANAASGNVVLAADGSFTYDPNADFNGSDSFSYQVQDGALLSNTVTVSINVAAVNDVPVFNAGATVTVLEDSGSFSQSGWATGVAAGPNDETESVSFTIVSVTPAGIVSNVALSPTGELTFDTVTDANGTVAVDIELTDTGSPAETSATQQFTINITPVNDAPSFTKGADIVVAEDTAGNNAVSGWASVFVAGTNESDTLDSYIITSNSNAALFSTAPAIDSSGELTFTLAANANGSTTVGVAVMDDGGTANGGVDTSAAQTFTITITPVNDAPEIRLATSGSSLTIGGGNDFDIVLNPTTLPGDVSLEVYDLDGDTLDTTVSITSAPAGITTPAALTGAVSGTVFSWTGDAATSTVGTHVYTVTVTDGTIGSPVSYTVGVTVTDVAPSHTIAASWGDGLTQATAYTASSGIGISPSVMMSWITDANQSQTLSAVSVTELANPGTTAFTATFNSTGYAGAIVMAATRTLIFSDVGLHEFQVTITDSGANTFDVFVTMEILNQGNVQPIAGLPGTTDFVVGSDFDANVDPAGTLSNALIQLSDVDGDAITITSVVAAPAALANMSQPAVFTTALPPYNIDFSGTADANETPGTYTYTITITDNISAPVTFDVNIILNDLAPTWTDGADILTGDGQSNATPYEFTFQVGQLPLPLEIALWADENLGQTLVVSGTDYTTSPTVAFNPVMTATGSDGILTLETILNLQPADVGQHDLIITITDGGGVNFVEVHVRIIVDPAPPAETGGDDDDSGCASSTTGSSLWLIMLGLLGLAAVIRTRRTSLGR